MMEKDDKKPIRTAVFDVCDTLYYSNTTHDFIRYVMDREPASLRKFGYMIANSKMLPLRYILIFYSVKTGRDALKKFNVGMLRGIGRAELYRLARAFTAAYLDKRRIGQMHEIIESKKREGLRVVLCSSSIEPIVAAVSEALAVQTFVATSLEYDDDVSTGLIHEDITNSKLAALRERDLLGELVYAASDNTSDYELLSAAKNASVVVHGSRKMEFWRKHHFEMIQLNL